MNNEFQPCEVIESNLLDPTKPTDLKTEFEVNDMDLDLYPAIGFQYKSTEANKYNDVKLYEVSICNQRNQDKEIKTIRTQIKQSKQL